jgi:hypothetical protein
MYNPEKGDNTNVLNLQIRSASEKNIESTQKLDVIRYGGVT